jgi:hypothetical protein
MSGSMKVCAEEDSGAAGRVMQAVQGNIPPASREEPAFRQLAEWKWLRFPAARRAFALSYAFRQASLAQIPLLAAALVA